MLHVQSEHILILQHSGFVNGEGANVLTSPVALTTTATAGCGAGTYPISVSSAAAANYTINYVGGQLTVDPVPQLSGMDVVVDGNNQFTLSWQTITNRSYQIEYKDNITASTWTPLDGPVVGTGSIMSITNDVSASPQRFFRVGGDNKRQL